uniref:Uncharacterized protein n=1 Tax=Romanomermis culicivorax TaxID=13658 RepID=A0A915JSM6_ROMCU
MCCQSRLIRPMVRNKFWQISAGINRAEDGRNSISGAQNLPGQICPFRPSFFRHVSIGWGKVKMSRRSEQLTKLQFL